ncbi:hypothetical protein [Phenylobacterium conjunctum]|uniref:HeH/LEM domain-containing protein n=1 Tax=Phenylobacterium conjunctum TaxID=1298959 RepID=A0ABW3T0I9_9CAUL
MYDTPATVKIVSDVPETGGFIVINETDFNAEIHELYVAPEGDGTDAPTGGPELTTASTDAAEASGSTGGASELTKAEIITDLEALGVDYSPAASKAVLLEIRAKARAERDAKAAEAAAGA